MGVSPSVFATWRHRGYPSRKGALLALKYIRLKRALLATCGDDHRQIFRWLDTKNWNFLYSTPIRGILSYGEPALDDVLEYLEGQASR